MKMCKRANDIFHNIYNFFVRTVHPSHAISRLHQFFNTRIKQMGSILTTFLSAKQSAILNYSYICVCCEM